VLQGLNIPCNDLIEHLWGKDGEKRNFLLVSTL